LISFCQLHKTLYKESHETTDIDVYKQAPAIYTKPVCEQHEEILVRACKRCDRLICVECDVHGTDCTGILLNINLHIK